MSAPKRRSKTMHVPTDEIERARLYWELRDQGPYDKDLIEERAKLFPGTVPMPPLPDLALNDGSNPTTPASDTDAASGR